MHNGAVVTYFSEAYYIDPVHMCAMYLTFAHELCSITYVVRVKRGNDCLE